MSSRQNKKRKGRNNGLNRERTVTTLTEGPESSFLLPTSTEEHAGNNMSSPTFSVASSAGGPNIPPTNFQIPAGPYPAFSYSNYIPTMSAQSFTPQHPPQQYFHSSSQAPLQSQVSQPGQSDLELLEKLKETIKNNQHEYFRAVPQPAALASIYLGSKVHSQSQASYAEQPSFERPHSQSYPQGHDQDPSSPTEYGQRPLTQSSQVREGTGKMESSVSDPPILNNVLRVSSGPRNRELTDPSLLEFHKCPRNSLRCALQWPPV